MGFHFAGKASKAGRLETIGSLVHSQQRGGLPHPNPSTLSNLPKDGVFLPASVDDHCRQFDFSVVLASKWATTGDFFICPWPMLKPWLFIQT